MNTVSLSNLWDLLASAAARAPSAAAVVDGGTSHTYAQIAARTERLAAWLHAQGLRPGDRLAICVRKGVEEIIAVFAAARLGAVFVNIHPQWTLGQLHHALLDSSARLLIVEPARLRELRELPDVPQLVVLGKGEVPEGALRFPDLDAPSDDTTEPARLEVEPAALDAIAALLYTSGSTGKAKGVMHSHRNLIEFAANVAQYLHNTADDRVLGLLPISFGYGLSQLLTTFYAGAALVLQRTGFPAEIVKTLRAQHVTGLAAVPMVWKQLLSYLEEQPTDLPALRYVTNAGGKMSDRNAQRMQRNFPNTSIVLMYGSTEALRSTYVPAALFAQKPGAIGKAIPNVQVFCITGDGRLAAPGEVGELVHCGAHISQGYWNNPDATRLRFRTCPALRERVGGDIVYFSGDVVRVDEDGVFWFVSRADWMVKSGGFRFSTNEVEELIAKSELVGDVVAYAIDDEQMEQVVHAVVTPPAGAVLSMEALERHCMKHLPSYMTPRKFHVWPGPLPTTANGKLDRQSLWQKVTEAAPAAIEERS